MIFADKHPDFHIYLMCLIRFLIVKALVGIHNKE